MVNKIVVSGVALAVVLVTGIIALTPVGEAQVPGSAPTKVPSRTSEFVHLKGITLPHIDGGMTADSVEPGDFLLLHDTTPSVSDVHVAIVVPCDGPTGDEDPEYTIVAGIAPGVAPIISFADVVGPLSKAGTADDAYDGVCTYHVTTTSNAITDVALIQATGLPGNGDGLGEADDTSLSDPHSVTIYGFP